MQLYENRIREIATNLGMTPNIVKINTRDCNVATTLQNIQAGANDVLWCAYMGHGHNSGDGYPGFVGCDATRSSLNFNLSVLYDRYIVTSSARLRIISFESCNYGQTTRPRYDDEPGAPNLMWKKLFLEASGTIKMCSSAATLYSYEAENFGGFFSNSLFESICDPTLSGTTPKEAWEKVKSKTFTLTNAKDTQFGKPAQNPRIVLNLTTPSDRFTARGVIPPPAPPRPLRTGTNVGNTPDKPATETFK